MRVTKKRKERRTKNVNIRSATIEEETTFAAISERSMADLGMSLGSTSGTTTYHLEGFIQFLNVKDFGSVDAAHIPRELRRLLSDITTDYAETASLDDWIADRNRQVVAGLKLISPFHREMIEKILPFTCLEPPNPQYAKNHIRAIVRELNRWKFQTVFSFSDLNMEEKHAREIETFSPGYTGRSRRIRYGDLSARRRVFSWAAGKWIVNQGYIPQLDGKNRSLAYLYSIIANALVSGDLALLRQCPYCKNLLLAVKDKRTRFCPGHMRLYYDDPARAKVRVELSRGGIKKSHRKARGRL